MSLQPLTLQPGIYTEASDESALNRFKMGKNVRFWKGLPEKLAGWVKAVASGATFLGVCRALFSWSVTLSNYVALGTHLKLYLYDGTSYYDITPVRTSGTLPNNPFTTVNGSQTVTVAHNGHGLVSGDFAIYAGAVLFNNVTMNGTFVVQNVVDANSYTILATTFANASSAGGGNVVTYAYQIDIGNQDSIVGGGWGAGAYGAGTWGTPRSGLIVPARTWSLCEWGNDLIASPFLGSIYTWQYVNGVATPAILISAAPAQNLVVLVTEQSRQIVSFGGTDPATGQLDPRLVQWCDAEDYTDWTPTAVNLAGSERLDHGNTIVSAVHSRGGMVIITDKTVYDMVLSGDQFVFSFVDQGETFGGISPKCAADINGTVYYMGAGQFVSYDGILRVLPCDVASYVFTIDAARGFPGINWTQAAKIFCARNQLKNELIWFYASAGSVEIDSCVAYCYDPANPHWWLGAVSFTALEDVNVLSAAPIATKANGNLYFTETGVDDDGAALPYSLDTYDVEFPASLPTAGSVPTRSGNVVMMIRRFLPDCPRLAGVHQLTISGRKEPRGKVKVKGPRNFSPVTRWVGLKARFRQASFRLSSSAIGADIRVGAWRYDGEPVSEK